MNGESGGTSGGTSWKQWQNISSRQRRWAEADAVQRNTEPLACSCCNAMHSRRMLVAQPAGGTVLTHLVLLGSCM